MADTSLGCHRSWGTRCAAGSRVDRALRSSAPNEIPAEEIEACVRYWADVMLAEIVEERRPTPGGELIPVEHLAEQFDVDPRRRV